jgi:hypothetical protein
MAHGGARVGVAGGDLDVPQIHYGIQTGRERFSNHAELVTLKNAIW